MQPIHYCKISAEELPPYIPALARLRINVFREFPYLYSESEENERRYLNTYLNSRNFCLFAAFDGDEMVGATTCLPLKEEKEEVKIPFLEAGLALEVFTYFGESVLLAPYRGSGIGKKFFLLRESQALLFNTPYTTFCSVDRPADHPLRPEEHRFLDSFWEKAGYKKKENLKCTMEWEEIPSHQRKQHRLTFWIKRL